MNTRTMKLFVMFATAMFFQSSLYSARAQQLANGSVATSDCEMEPCIKLISKGKRAYQSSIMDNMGPDFALDGDRQTAQWTMSGNSFLVVALLGTYRVNSVRIISSEIILMERFLPMRVETRLFNSDWVTCGTIRGVGGYGKEHQISCRGVLASHVRLSRAGELAVAEVEVYGRPYRMGYKLLSRGKPALQSSTREHANASLAVDGKTKHMFTHTQLENQPWWQVDLRGEYHIFTVRIFNVYLTCPQCGARLTTVQVFTQPPDTNTWFLCGNLNEAVAVLGGVYEVNCRGVLASKVRLQLTARDYLELVEVEVFGTL